MPARGDNWCAYGIVVGNVVGESIFHDGPVELSSRVKVEQTPDWITEAGLLSSFSKQDQRDVKYSVLTFSSDYSCQALGDSDPFWNGSEPRSIQNSIEEEFRLAETSLWIAGPTPIVCGPVLHFSKKNDPSSCRHAVILKPTLYSPLTRQTLPSSIEIKFASKLLSTTLDLDRRKPLWRSIRTLNSALVQNEWDIRYLLLWIVLETLFGTGRAEITLKISQRLAFFIGDGSNKREIFKHTKKGYDLRSKLVHGIQPKTLDEANSLEINDRIESFIRKSLFKILMDDNLVEIFNGKNRDEYLDELLFQ